MFASCVKCGAKFEISKELERLLEDEKIQHLQINICPDCANLIKHNDIYNMYMRNHNRVIDIKLSSTADTFDILVYIETGV